LGLVALVGQVLRVLELLVGKLHLVHTALLMVAALAQLILHRVTLVAAVNYLLVVVSALDQQTML
jgi:hypothetical protein